MALEVWSWFWSNIGTISDLIIIGGAIVGGVAYLLQRRKLPKLMIRMTDERPTGVNWPNHDVYWRIENTGHSSCYDLTLTIVFALLPKPPVQRIHVDSLPPKRFFIFGYRYVKDTSPPQFEFSRAYNVFFESDSMEFDTKPPVKLEWGKDYEVHLACHFKDSDDARATFLLKVGDAKQPVMDMDQVGESLWS